jgi:uncharacterized membrane protein
VDINEKVFKVIGSILPTWQDIGQLGAIVGIRTVLNFFLTRELKQMGNIKSNVQN